MNADQDSIGSAQLPPVPSRRRWPMVALALAIFAAGVLSGAGLAVIVVVNRVQHAIRHPEAVPPRLAKVLQRRLDLDEAQRAKVEAIIAKRQTELATIRREFQPQINEQFDGLRDDIDQVLTEAQRERWQETYRTFLNRWLPPAPAAQPAAKP